MKFQYALLLIGSTLSVNAQENSFFLGNAAFQEGNIERAISYYQEAQRGEFSAATAAQLARCYEMQGQVGPALLNIERAKLMDPRNVSLQQAQRDWLESHLPSHPKPSRLENTVLHFSSTSWSYSLCIAIWLTLVLMAYPKVATIPQKTFRNTLWALNVLLLSSVIPGIYYHHQKSQQAIIIKDISMRVAPTAKSPTLQPIQQGEYVYPQKRHDDFFYVMTMDRHRSGWVSSQDVAWIIPRSS
ncbi:MAG: tetratricopeptide repeat protein [Puniceicoccales bacterium]|jgi:tetratricopeptide (TPR) repeat protein|nr:tetratricopeptide repeat protein [Puniceicoccales bacterium]